MYLVLWTVGSLLIAEAFTYPYINVSDSRAGRTECYTCANSVENTDLVKCDSLCVLRVVSCPKERPVCYSVAKITPDRDYYIGCGPDTGKDISFALETDPISNIKSIVYQCREQMCNRPIYRKFFLHVIGALKEDTNDTLTKLFQNFTNLNKDPMMHVLLNRTELLVRRRKRTPTELPTTTVKPILNDTIETIKAEPLKQQPQASEDDEDDGEGSGLSEDLKNHRRLASSPSDPSSFLPAKENRAYYYKAPNILAMVMSIILV